MITFIKVFPYPSPSVTLIKYFRQHHLGGKIGILQIFAMSSALRIYKVFMQKILLFLLSIKSIVPLLELIDHAWAFERGILWSAWDSQTWLRAFNESFEVIDVKIPTLKILNIFRIKFLKVSNAFIIEVNYKFCY